MPPPPGPQRLNIQHVFTFFRTLGGVQSVLRRHLDLDSQYGLTPSLITFFDPPSQSRPHCTHLGLNWANTIHQTRRKLRQLPNPNPDQIAIAHNLWGLTFWADLIPCSRRIGILHSDWPGMPNFLDSNRRLLDGVLCVSTQLLELAHKHLPELDSTRCKLIHYPVRNYPRPPLNTNAAVPGTPIRIGFCGRIQKEQKRIDRIPPLLKSLTSSGTRFSLEVIGEGPDLPWLKNQLKQFPSAAFHGRLEGDAYWQMLSTLDLILFVSDYEGLPISLLEALSLGVIPVFPSISCGADAYVASIDPRLLNPPGDIPGMVATIHRLFQSSAQDRLTLRQKAIEAAAPHEESNYFRTFSAFVTEMSALPRISADNTPLRKFHWSDHCPYGLLSRFAPMSAWRSPL